MPSYCCFNCPTGDYTDKKLTDVCPSCGYAYGFPNTLVPPTINEYEIVRPLARGFYSAAYIAKYGKLGDLCVLKVSSKRVYEFFGKDFEAECRMHQLVARDSEHVVGIRDMFDADIQFGDIDVACHVALLNYVNGESLEEYLRRSDYLTTRTIAQIGIDLFRIIGDLEGKTVSHNDLHSGNIIIQELGPGSHRAEAIDNSIRAVVIDLASVSDESKSNEQRLGDVHWVARHLRSLARKLLARPSKASDTEYRLASLLDERASMLEPQVTSQRRPSIEQCIFDIREVYNQVLSPWKERLVLRRFDDAYNAQTLAPWFVPLLLVDPDKHWQSAVSTKGPQVIVGMRGCGKTMLLRSLQFHARATAEQPDENTEKILERLKQDGYVALYVSGIKLIDNASSIENSQDHYAKLLIAYGLECLRAARHLQELNPEMVPSRYYREIADGIADYLSGPEDLNLVGSEFELERRLIEIQIALGNKPAPYVLKGQPADAFARLAQAIRKCSPLWRNHYVLFLLDDVSTRFLNQPRTLELLSELTFQSPDCAFKLTTEAQTLELGLKSPGQIERARLGRDYTVFDLGGEVYAKVKTRSGKAFVERILKRRAQYYPNHPKVSPTTILGDVTLESIAERIVATSDTSRSKKEIYHGISVLSGLCVGDLGDVIAIYELILKNAAGKETPVPPDVQSDCLQGFYSRRLYDLNRKENRLKDFALSFADAAHKLLVQSNETRKLGKLKRLRQYNKIYVRITAGDSATQFNQLRDLIDAGVFILDGGSDTPRSKTRDSDPIHQFVLTYRKLFGLGSYIGLAERDRFELSGHQLIDWLTKPANGAEILMRNLQPESEIEEDEDAAEEQAVIDPDETQAKLFETVQVIGDVFQTTIRSDEVENEDYLKSKTPRVKTVRADQLKTLRIDSLILGLGFETRTLESAKRLLEHVRPSKCILIKYHEPGYGKEITDLAQAASKEIEVLSYNDLDAKGLVIQGNALVDVTGLAKPAIFQAVRSALRRSTKIWICDTRAQVYYPNNEDIKQVLDSKVGLDYYKQLEALRRLLTGEKGRYDCEKQLISDADESRRRMLCAFSSPKHERLLTLLDERRYDRIEIVAPNGKSPRSQLARLAANVAVDNYANTSLTLIGSHEIDQVLRFLTERYQSWYVNGGFNFELALTGSKLQAVACAVMSASVKVSQCWYVSPLRFDPERFTIGVGDSFYYQLSLPNE